MRLALFGPAPPLRGGIVAAQANLYRTLQARGHDLHWTSFRRQYPGFLFPGSAQEGPTAPWLQRPSRPVFVPWEPWTWRAAARDLLAFAPDGVVARWWIPFFAPGFRADVLLLDADPSQDVSVLRSGNALNTVIKDGAVAFRRGALTKGS